MRVRSYPSLRERFLEKINPTPTQEGCLEWTACKNKAGYGQIGSNGNRLRAHRVAYEMFVGPIPEGLCVLHRCDNPSCVNHARLFLGTRTDNMADRKAKGRYPVGEAHRCARHTDAQVAEAQALIASGRSRPSVARQFGVTQPTIRNWINNKRRTSKTV